MTDRTHGREPNRAGRRAHGISRFPGLVRPGYGARTRDEGTDRMSRAIPVRIGAIEVEGKIIVAGATAEAALVVRLTYDLRPA